MTPSVHDIVVTTPIRDAKLRQAIDKVRERLNVWAAMTDAERADLREWFPEQLVLAVVLLTASEDEPDVVTALRELLDVIALEEVLPDIEPSQRARAVLAKADGRVVFPS